MKRLSPILLLMLLCSCSDAQLQKVAKSLDATAKAISIVQTTVIEANKQLLISDDDTATILKACVIINQAGKDTVSVIKPLTALDVSNKQMILRLITPGVNAVQGLLDANLAFKNEDTKQSVRASLLVVQSALSAIQIIVAGG
jgi:hypothetical protein